MASRPKRILSDCATTKCDLDDTPGGVRDVVKGVERFHGPPLGAIASFHMKGSVRLVVSQGRAGGPQRH